MSTRAQIAIEGSKVLVYKHSDGYPDGVLPILSPFVKDFMESRGWDPDYMVARLAQRIANARDGEMGKLPADAKAPFDAFLGVGIDCEVHGNIAYLYRVTRDGTIRVCVLRSGRKGTDPWNTTAWVTEQTIPLRTNPVPMETP